MSFIPCLAHIINLICKDVLATLKAGSVREAKAMLDEMAAQKNQAFTFVHTTKGAIVKIRLLVLWIARSPHRRQDWREVSPGKQIRYDIDNRWNSTYLMISDAIRLRMELTQFIRTHTDVQVLQPSENEWLTLQQVEKVLKPFWNHTNMVSKACPTIVESLPIYWHLDDLLDDIKGAKGDFEGVNADIRDAVEGGIRKMNKFARMMDDKILYYVASVLDPRIKTSCLEAQMSNADALLIASQVRDFLKKQYPFNLVVPSSPERPPGMSETIWRTLQTVQPFQGTFMSDIDRYLDSQPVNWSHHLIEDGDPDFMTDSDILADNVARRVIIEHVHTLTMLAINMFERACDMFNLLKARYAERSRDRQADLMSEVIKLHDESRNLILTCICLQLTALAGSGCVDINRMPTAQATLSKKNDKIWSVTTCRQ
ncbi:ribonuclease H-like domain-containing protein [Lipomyces chichibuensis]|uniref:ribonuclease H-like domain-containing protein n=1 Tax=Lipomyces chichibuensis TaxID=1546026 RepID=UPI003343D0D7